MNTSNFLFLFVEGVDFILFKLIINLFTSKILYFLIVTTPLPVEFEFFFPLASSLFVICSQKKEKKRKL